MGDVGKFCDMLQTWATLCLRPGYATHGDLGPAYMRVDEALRAWGEPWTAERMANGMANGGWMKHEFDVYFADAQELWTKFGRPEILVRYVKQHRDNIRVMDTVKKWAKAVSLDFSVDPTGQRHPNLLELLNSEGNAEHLKVLREAGVNTEEWLRAPE